MAVGGRREPIREVAHCRRGRRGASEAAGSRWEAGNLPGRPKVGRPEGATAAGAVRWRRLGQWYGGDS